MMGLWGRKETLRAIEEATARLAVQIGVLTEQVAALSTQLAAETERSLAADAETRQLRRRLDEHERLLADHAAAARAQAEDITQLREQGDGRAEAIRQLRGDVARTQRQAEIDLDEMRRTNDALARGLLLGTTLDSGPGGGE